MPVTTGGKNLCALPISGLQANCTIAPKMSAVMPAAELTAPGDGYERADEDAKNAHDDRQAHGPMKPTPSADIMGGDALHAIIVPLIMVMRVSFGRLRRRATISGPPTIAVNITSDVLYAEEHRFEPRRESH